jgi:CubicO group peptidase (beta-lactamase class C family)
MISLRPLVTGTLFLALASGQSAPEKPAVDRIFAEFTQETPGCAVGVAQNGTTVFRGGYGLADLERRVAITPDTVFESGSVAKQFTAAAVMLLAKEGKLSLDDAMRKHLAELRDYGAPLTIRHVLSHISGLREWRPLATFSGMPEGTRVYSNPDLLEYAALQQALNFDPGTAYSYSNTGYNAIPILVGRVLPGRTFESYTEDVIFKPLGMTRTKWRNDFRAVVPNRALAYAKGRGGWSSATPIENIIGAGGLLTTVGDLLLWNENFTHTRVGGPDFVRAQQASARLTSGHEIGYAAGLMVGSFEGTAEVSHSGATGGYRTWLARYPDKAVSIAVLCNSAAANPTRLGRDTARLWTKTTRPKEPAAATVSPDRLAALAGLYRRERDNGTVELRLKDGTLTWQGSGALRPVSASEFLLATGNRVSFATGGIMMFRAREGDIGYRQVTPWTPSVDELSPLAGRYTSLETRADVVIRQQGAALTLQIGKGPEQPMRPTFQDSFSLDEGHSITFRRDSTGTVRQLSVGDARVWDLRFSRAR